MTTPPGWYPDPADAANQRYFDGSAWSGDVRPAPAPAPAPDSAPWPGPDVIATPAAAGRSTGKKVLLAGAATVVTLGVAGGAYALSALSGGGAQPESVLPADAIAYAEIDLDPAAGQKLAVFRLAQRFPRAEVTSQDDVEDDLLGQALDDALPAGTSFDQDVAPWIGRRAGVAALGGLGDDDEPVAVVALQVADRGEAEAALSRLRTAARADGAELGFAFSDDYVVLAQAQQTADAAVARAARAPLSDDADYTGALEALGGDQVATAYLDVGGLYDALPDDVTSQYADNPLVDDGARPSGALVLGLSAGSDHVQLTGRAVGLTTGLDQEGVLGAAAGAELVEDLPAEALAALSATGVGPGLSRLYDRSQEALQGLDESAEGADADLFGLDAALDQYGLDLPKDLEAVFGDQLAVAVLGQGPDVTARVRGGDPDRALALLEELDASGQTDGLVRREGDDLLVASNPELLERAATPGGLGDSEVFRSAVPDVEGAGLVFFLDIAKALTTFDAQDRGGDLDDDQRADLEQLEALGLTARGGADGSFTVRLTVR